MGTDQTISTTTQTEAESKRLRVPDLDALLNELRLADELDWSTSATDSG